MPAIKYNQELIDRNRSIVDFRRAKDAKFYTVISPKSGEHRTVKIETVQEQGFLKGKRIISLLIGSDNTSNYKGFGFVNEKNIVVWKKFQNPTEENFNWQKFADMIFSLLSRGTESPFLKLGVTIEESKRCLVCNRLLTNPDSLESQIGPECAKKL